MRHVATTTMTIALIWFALPALAAQLVDPTQPAEYVAVPGSAAAVSLVPSGPILQSTIVSPQRKSAVISGKPVKIGDTYEGSTIVDIMPYEVRMSRGGRETTLRLLPKLAKDKGKGKVE